MNIYEEGLRLLKNEEAFVFASIISNTGSTPRSKGTKMIVRRDGSLYGTVGGGIMEARCIQKCTKALNDKESYIYEFHLSNKDAYKSEMVCGGSGEILISYIDSKNTNLQVLEKVVDTINNNKKGWIITVIKNNNKQFLFVDDKNEITGENDIGDFMKSKLQNSIEGLRIHADSILDERYIVEKIHSTGKAFIFGAGHVSKETASILDMLEFETIVIDDRSEFANKDRFPNSQVIVLDSLDNIGGLGIDDDSYILIITRGHLHDYNVLEWALRTKAYYIGMIGSKSKIKMTYEKIKKAGFTENDIERVFAPIGIELEAKTPAEIAVSIAGQMINERAKKEREKR